MWRAAVLVGRSVADLSTAALCTLIVAVTGLVIGWRPGASIASVIAGFALFLFFSYALSWGCGCLGIVSKGPELAQGIGLVILFPLAIVSNGLVPTQHMPTVLRVIADWNPVSAVTAAARHLGQPQPLGDHPRLAHATPGSRLPAVVRRAPGHLRPPRHPPLPPTHHRLNSLQATTAAIGNWPRTISGYATSSPKRSDSSAPPASVPILGPASPATKRKPPSITIDAC
jgi:ABC-2 type transporter